MTMQRKTRSKKENTVKDLEALFQKYPIFAIADLKGLKASQLQVLKKKFKDDLEIHVAKNRLVKRAMEKLAKKYVRAEEITKIPFHCTLCSRGTRSSPPPPLATSRQPT